MLLSLVALAGVLLVVPETDARTAKQATPTFNQETHGRVTSGYIGETSGICASRIHSDVLYVLNDSGGKNRIFAINARDGHRMGTIYINGAHNHDWEDLACGACPGGGGHCIYIADTGGNAGGEENVIYRIQEPSSIHDQSVNTESKLMFHWDQHDCESIMVDPQGEVYVISKVNPGHHCKLVHLPRSAWGTGHHEWVNDGVYMAITSSTINPVSASISPNGKEVLVKALQHVYYWSVPDGNYEAHMTAYQAHLPHANERQGESACWDPKATQVLVKALQHVYYWSVPDGNYEAHMTAYPAHLPHANERQGESVCWDPKGEGYYTLSEGFNQNLYYFKRTGGFELVGK